LPFATTTGSEMRTKSFDTIWRRCLYRDHTAFSKILFLALQFDLYGIAGNSLLDKQDQVFVPRNTFALLGNVNDLNIFQKSFVLWYSSAHICAKIRFYRE